MRAWKERLPSTRIWLVKVLLDPYTAISPAATTGHLIPDILFISTADLHHVDADADPDPIFHYDADSDPAFQSDPDPTIQFDPDPDPTTHFLPDLDPQCPKMTQ